MASNKVSKANPDEAIRLYSEGWNHDDIARKLGVSSSTVGRYISGGSRSTQYRQLNALLRQAYAVSVGAETLNGVRFTARDLTDAEDWDDELTRLISSARRLRTYLRALTATEGNTP